MTKKKETHQKEPEKSLLSNSFELQLVVIGILIPLYLDVIPSLIRPVIWPSPFTFTMVLPKIISYILGFSWFICLLCGTYSLISRPNFYQERFRGFYNGFFMFNNLLTVLLVVILISTYIAHPLVYYLVPIYQNHLSPALKITFSLFILLLIGFIFKNSIIEVIRNVMRK